MPDQNIEARKIVSFLEYALTFCFISPYFIPAGITSRNASIISRRVLLVRWKKGRTIISSYFQKVKHFLRNMELPLREIVVQGEFDIAIVSSIYLLQFTIYMAIASAIDAAPTSAIDILKKASLA